MDSTDYSDFLNSWTTHTKRLELCNPADYLVKRDMENNAKFKGSSEISLTILRMSEKGVDALKQVSLEDALIVIHRNINIYLIRGLFAGKKLNFVEFYRMQSDNLRCFELASSIKQIETGIYETTLTRDNIFYKFDSLVFLKLTIHFNNELSHQRKLFNSLQYLSNLSELYLSFKKLPRSNSTLNCSLIVNLSNGLVIQPRLGFILPPMNVNVKISMYAQIFNNFREIRFFRNRLNKLIQWDKKYSCRCRDWKMFEEIDYQKIKSCITENY